MKNGNRRAPLKHLLPTALITIFFLAGIQPVFSQTPIAGYILDEDDVLEVTVWGHPELTHVVTVRRDGKITLPVVGTIQAAGLSVERLTQNLTQAYAVYLINPQVAVIVKESRKIRISVLGQVSHPGTYLLPPGSRLLDALSAAGGVTEAAAMKEAKLLHPRRPTQVVNLESLLAGEPTVNLLLYGGETLVVPEDLVNLFYVLGEVARPGRYRLKGEMRIIDALLTAGGLTDRASITQARLVRESRENQALNLDSIILRQDMSRNITLQPGDTLFIPEETNNKIYVIGDVNHPGIYPLKGTVTLLQAVAMAGGPVQRGLGTAKTAHVVRRNDASDRRFAQAGYGQLLANGSVLMTFDLQAMMRDGDLSRDEALRAGDVVVIPETGMSGLQIILNMVSTILFGIHR